MKRIGPMPVEVLAGSHDEWVAEYAGRFGGSVGVHMPVGSTRTVGNLAIDVVDVQLNAEIWRGTLDAAFRTPEPAADNIRAAVQHILAKFPDRSL